MTVERQEKYLRIVEKLEKENKDKNVVNTEASKMLILDTLQIIDSNITMKDINNMHPADFTYISSHIWDIGREIEGEKSDFQKKK